MKAKDMMPLLTAWARRQRELTKQMDALYAITGNSNGPLFLAVWGVWNEYTSLLSRWIGDYDDRLTWFEAENRMGLEGLEAATDGGKPRKVRTLHQLAKLIEKDQA